MKVTIENWSSVQQEIRKSGIKAIARDSNEVLQVITTNSGDKFEFSLELFEQFKNAGLLKIGIKVNRPT